MSLAQVCKDYYSLSLSLSLSLLRARTSDIYRQGEIMQIAAVKTDYKGVDFRSRLEARWARFFDALGILWKYEPEPFKLAKGVWYLPDFWLPQVSMWAEVKPVWPNETEMQKATLLATLKKHPCLLLNGQPSTKNYWAVMPDGRLADFVPAEGRYHLTEARFFSGSGLQYPEQAEQPNGDEDAVRFANLPTSEWVPPPRPPKTAAELKQESIDKLDRLSAMLVEDWT